MSHHKEEIKSKGLSPEEVKELELDEQPKPTRKINNPTIPLPDNQKKRIDER